MSCPRCVDSVVIVIFAENASFTCKLRRHLLVFMALTTPKPQNTDTNGIHEAHTYNIIIILYLCKIAHALRVSKHVTESIRNIARGVGIN